MKNETINTTEIARLWNTHQDAVKNFLDKKNVAAVAQMKFGRGTMRLWDKGVLSLTDEFSEYKKKLIENSREALARNSGKQTVHLKQYSGPFHEKLDSIESKLDKLLQIWQER